jgi:hypothetical protein
VWLLKALIDVVVVTVWTTYRLCADSNDIPLDTRTHRTGLSRREVKTSSVYCCVADNSVEVMVLHQQNHATENGAGSGWTGVNILDKNYEEKDPHPCQVL